MHVLDTRSLVTTLDNINDALFYGREIPAPQREEAAKWISARQGSYANLFAPTDEDLRRPAPVFTGETVSSYAGTLHILGEEACRAVALLDVQVPEVTAALERARRGIYARLGPADGQGAGHYCCTRCSVALWRNLLAGGFQGAQRRLAAGVAMLRSRRGEDGRWRSFPFYYSLLALAEMDFPEALEELRFAAPVCERVANRTARKDKFTDRRRVLAERVLARC